MSPLPPHAVALLRALVPIVTPAIPTNAADATSVDDSDFTERVLQQSLLTVASFPRAVRLALRAGLETYDQSARLWPKARGRAARTLPADRAAAWFALWWQSPVPVQRELVRGIKSFMALAYYEQPEVKAALDYTPERWIERVRVRRLEVYRGDIERHQRALIERDPLPPMIGGAA